jgi:NtrC-family two-component system sensor histidine kinase KinB
MKRPPALASRIRNGSLLMLLIALLLGVVEFPQVYELGGSIRRALYRNYLSIEAAHHMHAALYNLQLAQRDGNLPQALAPNRDLFEHWIDIELSDITEVGEADVAGAIKQRGTRLMAELAANPKGRYDPQYVQLRVLLDRLIDINQQAMFRADSRATRMSEHVATIFGAGLVALLLIGVALAWTLAWSISRPLNELAERLRSFSLRGPSLRLGEQPLAELAGVAAEFNRMAERLEQFEQLNVERLIYEKRKTEVILESVEDGIVLVDPKGVVTHINELAAIILGVEREEALGSPIDDLSSNHPHYLRVRSALQAAAKRPVEAQRVEVELHVRGRDHTYVLKRIPLRPAADQSFGTIVILQDITYLRDQDRARTNLVATLSHELKTPLTSLALSAGLLARDRAQLAPKDQELVSAINEDINRIRHLADDLLDLVKGTGGAISLRAVKLDLPLLIATVLKGFALQAEQKGVEMVQEIEPELPQVRADAVKLSWVLSNLLTNALRHTPTGGRISLGAQRGPRMVRLWVSDTGPGVSADMRDHLFERYAQGTIDGAQPGAAGLGLAIVKEIVEAHGGRIFVHSEPGQGTSFKVELPLAPEDSWPDC